MKQKKIIITVICIICFMAVGGAVYSIAANKMDNIEKEKKGGDGSGMFEYPKPEKISVIQDGKDTIEITDKDTIKNIVSQCTFAWKTTEVPSDESVKIWLDFNNGRAVLGISEDGKYAAVGKKKGAPLEFEMPEQLYSFICKVAEIQ